VGVVSQDPRHGGKLDIILISFLSKTSKQMRFLKFLTTPYKFLLARREILEEEYGQTYYVSVPPPSVSLSGAVFSSVIPT
jgi:hypothetical protein